MPSMLSVAPQSAVRTAPCRRAVSVACSVDKEALPLLQTIRRRLGVHLLSAAAAAAVAAHLPPAVAAVDAPSLTPYQRGLALEYGLDQDGRIRSCPTDANPNCVSTSATNTVGARGRLGRGGLVGGQGRVGRWAGVCTFAQARVGRQGTVAKSDVW